MTLKKGFFLHLGLLGLITILLALPKVPPARAQESAESDLRIEWRLETEPEYHHKYTNCVLVQGVRKLVFQPPTGWIVRLQAPDKKVICHPLTADEWMSLQLVETNALVSKAVAVAIPVVLNTTNAPASTNAVAATNAPAASNVSTVKPESLEQWFKASLPSAQLTQFHPIYANGREGVAAAVSYLDNGRLRTCQIACVDLSTNFVVVTHALRGTNLTSIHLNGVLNSLSLETNAPAR